MENPQTQEVSPEPPKQRNKGGRPKVLDTSIEFRVPWADYFLVNALASYEKRDVAEFMRMQVNDLRRKARRSRDFKSWLERHRDDLQQAGNSMEAIF